MIEFTNAKDLMEHYAKIKNKLWGPLPVRVQTVQVRALPVSPAKEPEPVKQLTPPKRRKHKVVYVLRKDLLSPKPKSIKIMELPALFEPICQPEPRLTFKEVMKVVLEITNLRQDELFARRRYKVYTDARHLLWALSRHLLHHLSLPQIAFSSGSWDHTTVLHGSRQGINHPDYDRAYAYLFDILEQRKRAANATLDNDVNEEVG